jgi:hypothetical protein
MDNPSETGCISVVITTLRPPFGGVLASQSSGTNKRIEGRVMHHTQNSCLELVWDSHF